MVTLWVLALSHLFLSIAKILEHYPIFPKPKCLPETDALCKACTIIFHAKFFFFFCFSDYLTDVSGDSDPKS